MNVWRVPPFGAGNPVSKFVHVERRIEALVPEHVDAVRVADSYCVTLRLDVDVWTRGGWLTVWTVSGPGATSDPSLADPFREAWTEARSLAASLARQITDVLGADG